MTDDIVTRLRGECQCSDDCRGMNDPCISMRAADEIERLRKTAYALIDELRYNGGYEAYTTKMLFMEFYEKAVQMGGESL